MRKNKIFYEKIDEFFSVGDETLHIFENAVNTFISGGITEGFKILMENTSTLEARADSLLHKMNNFLYENSLLPETREDILVLFERYDDIIDGAYHILRYIYTRDISLPSFMEKDLQEILKVSLLCYNSTRESIKELFGNRGKIKVFMRNINNYEAIADEIQYRMIRTLFTSKENDYQKIILSDLVKQFSNLADICEKAADTMAVIDLKRVI